MDYSRAMASYGAYLAMCGYQYDDPEGKLAFAPRMQQQDFRAAFTTAEGWGSFSQKLENNKQVTALELRYGKLALKEFSLDLIPGVNVNRAEIKLAEQNVNAKFVNEQGRVSLQFIEELRLKKGQRLDVVFS